MRPITVQNKTLNMVYIAMFTVLITICAWIAIPTVVPFTLQTFGVFVTVGLLGGKRAVTAVIVYLLLGVVGLPVFTGFQGGIGVLAGATGGYIIGLLFITLVMWGIEKLFGRKPWIFTGSMVLGLLVCYLFGTVWYQLVFLRGGKVDSWLAILGICVFPFVIPDIVKIVLALLVTKSVTRVIK